MINRSLIRIKTVQILYSYLLTRSDFHLEAAPDSATSTPDRQFAYSVYLDYIFLLLKLSGLHLGNNSGLTLDAEHAIKKNRVGKALRTDPAVQTAITKYRNRLDKFDDILPELVAAIAETPLYDSYKRKRKLELADDVNFWTTIFTTIISKNKSIERVMRLDDIFSHVGMETGLNMFISTLSSFDDTKASYQRAKNELTTSLSQAYTLYIALLYLPVLLTDLQAQKMEEARKKYLPKPEDLEPSTRLIDNLYIKALRDCKGLEDYLADNTDADISSWRDSDTMLNKMLSLITSSELYTKYMAKEAGNFTTDAMFWREVMRTIILPSDELTEALESKSVYWNDDLQIMGTFVLKTIRRTYPAADDAEATADPSNYGKVVLLPKFMNSEDEVFGTHLFEYVVKNREQYREYIDRFINKEQWDSERLAFMDIIILTTAIAEIINYPSIPVPVTLNEYIEIANDYSTARSGQFINGVLYNVIKLLNEEGVINK